MVKKATAEGTTGTKEYVEATGKKRGEINEQTAKIRQAQESITAFERNYVEKRAALDKHNNELKNVVEKAAKEAGDEFAKNLGQGLAEKFASKETSDTYVLNMARDLYSHKTSASEKRNSTLRELLKDANEEKPKTEPKDDH
jgi:hypothetical protein